MSALFYLPKAVAIDGGRAYPGAKLYFYLTGTTTPTNTYTDDDRTTPHDNPVVADSTGVFAPIYLDPNTVYRVTYRQSDESLIYTSDPVNSRVDPYFRQTQAEIDAGVVPVDYRYQELDVFRYGAVNGTTSANDSSAAFQSAFNVAKSKGGGEITAKGKFFLSEGTYFEGDSAASRAGPLKFSGHGCVIYMDDNFTRVVSPTHSALCGALSGIEVQDYEISGVKFIGTKDIANGLFTEANRSNWPEPDSSVACGGPRIQGFNRVRVNGCHFEGLQLALVINDEDPRSGGTVPAGETMDSAFAVVTDCSFYYNWQHLSFTFGSAKHVDISHNRFETGVVKLLDIIDSGFENLIHHNHFVNMPTIFIGMSHTAFTDNTLDNCIGGIDIRASSDYPSTNYGYHRRQISVARNKVFSNGTWESMNPIAFIVFTTTAASVQSQSVEFEDIEVVDNQIEVSGSSSTTAGSMINVAGDADITLKNFKFSRNICRLINANGRMISLPDSAVTTFNLDGTIEIKSNRFERDAVSGNIEIGIYNPTYAASAELIFDDNSFDTDGTNAQLHAERFGYVSIRNNRYRVGRASTATSGLNMLNGCPRIDAHNNEVVRSSTDSRGHLLAIGIVDSGDQSAMESNIVRMSHNRMNYGLTGFNSYLTYAAGFGLIESVNDLVTPGLTAWISSNANMETYNVVNPDRNNTITISASDANSVVRSGYEVRTTRVGTGENIGFRLGASAWLTLGTLP